MIHMISLMVCGNHGRCCLMVTGLLRKPLLLLPLLLWTEPLHAMEGLSQQDIKAPNQIIVKLKSQTAKIVESALPTDLMEISRSSGGKPVDSMFGKFKIKKIRPAYPELIRMKQKKGLTD